MSACSNCKITLGCSCQRRTASNGVPVCTSCIGAYEASLLAAKTTPAPAVNPVNPNNPNNIVVSVFKT